MKKMRVRKYKVNHLEKIAAEQKLSYTPKLKALHLKYNAEKKYYNKRVSNSSLAFIFTAAWTILIGTYMGHIVGVQETVNETILNDIIVSQDVLLKVTQLTAIVTALLFAVIFVIFYLMTAIIVFTIIEHRYKKLLIIELQGKFYRNLRLFFEKIKKNGLEEDPFERN